MNDHLKHDILLKIRQVASDNGGKPPGIARFESATGVKRHEWLGKIWRNWSDAIIEAGFTPNELQGAWDELEILQIIAEISKAIRRFPSSSDLKFELHHRPNSPDTKTVLARWNMPELAAALADYAEQNGEQEVASYARAYTPRQRGTDNEGGTSESALGHVYMQRHNTDYKIGFTTSLNKRGRQIQIELPQEIELVHSILTDDPAGVESYWHKRFAAKRTRGEWFKLTKSDVAAFKRWSKIW
ncbi:GIY-YIG nuclease family protein [Agrobacterium rhizogenes]|nr:GIY-YIG nuclease family protein [Rhizobium rhizogenes]NTJ83635.1 GIY-YIG nuclease family protein [Rhizobium rhizogenes]